MRNSAIMIAILGILVAEGPAFAQRPLPTFDSADAESDFAFDLFAKLAQPQDNLVISPFSIANGLDMVFLGANGATATEMANVLHLQDMQDKNFREALVQTAQHRNLFQQTYGNPALTPPPPSDGFQFQDADALWGATGEKSNSDYLASVKAAFKSDLFPVDFANAIATSVRINAWVSDRTRGHITNLISPSAINPQTKLILTDAVYFKAGWLNNFKESDSKPGKFQTSLGHTVMVRMMHATRLYSMMRGDGVKMLEIPYRHYDASLLIILPDAKDGLPAVLSKLNSDQFYLWREYEQTFNVAVTLPTFKAESDIDLKTALQALGMKGAFTPGQADLSGIIQNAPLYLGDVVHKAFIDVQEKGTIAAAATGLGPVAASIEPAYENETFIADHPFIYVLRANGSGDILFMGIVENPAQSVP